MNPMILAQVLSGALCIFFFNDTATTEIYTLSLHDALPICFGTGRPALSLRIASPLRSCTRNRVVNTSSSLSVACLEKRPTRSEEHTSELQSRQYLVCRLLLEKKNEATRYLLALSTRCRMMI